MLRYKAESAGCELAKVNPRNTTKTCSKCGNTQEMPRWKRTYKYGNCGVELDRDYNAAINILNKFTRRRLRGRSVLERGDESPDSGGAPLKLLHDRTELPAKVP